MARKTNTTVSVNGVPAQPKLELSRADKRALMAAVLYQPRQASFNSKMAIHAALTIADDILEANETFKRHEPVPEPVQDA